MKVTWAGKLLILIQTKWVVKSVSRVSSDQSRQYVKTASTIFNKYIQQKIKSQTLLYTGNHFILNTSYKPFPEMGPIHTERVEVSDHYSKRDKI